MSEELKDALNLAKKNESEISGLTKSVNTLVEKLTKTSAQGTPSPNDVFNIRRGENTMSSRPFSFMKALGVMSGAIPPEQARHECGISERLKRCYGSEYAPGGRPGPQGQHFLMPLSTAYMGDQYVPADFRHEMKSMVADGTRGADTHSMTWVANKAMGIPGYQQKALSWLNELTGGSLVAPPEMGELIELLRNKEALVNAGARTVPLPPQGRLKYPRQTAASTTYWVGENSPITESVIGTGEVTLQAKKLAVLIKAPNELIRFASPAAEALLRDDMTKSLALGLDLAGLEGQGGDTRPRGIINMPFITKITSSQPNPNGDTIVANDVYRFISAVEEANAEYEAFIMRPKTLYKYYQLRADAVAQGDRSGVFLFNMIREAKDDAPATIAGYPVVKSTQVSQSRSKGTQSNLTYIVGGMFSDFLIGLFGSIEFAATTMGDTSFANDQTWVRGILSADMAARHEAAFCLMDQVDPTV